MSDLERWKAIISFHQDYSTWDQVVECYYEEKGEGGITAEEASTICGLGYYGHDVKPEHAAMLAEGKKWVSPFLYMVEYRGVDGKDATGFATLEEAKAYVMGRLGSADGNDSFRSDYARYHLVGFTLADIGVKWENTGEER